MLTSHMGEDNSDSISGEINQTGICKQICILGGENEHSLLHSENPRYGVLSCLGKLFFPLGTLL